MKHKQPNLYRILANSLEKNVVSHAYLLHGTGDLLESGLWLSSVLMSKELENQELIERFKNGESVDFLLLDGMAHTIKKDEILQAQAQFNKTPQEVYQHKVLLFNQCHLASKEALNSILKMIEEPQGFSTSFVLTSSAIETVLPTIRSRCIQIALDKTENSIEEDQFDSVRSFLSQYQTNLEMACLGLSMALSGDREVLKEALIQLVAAFKEKLYHLEVTPLNQQCYQIFTEALISFSSSTNAALLVDHLLYQLLEVI